MSIKVWDYLEEYGEERADILDAVERVFGSGRLILGPSGERFEGEFAEYCGVPHGVGVNSGTDGLFLSLKALGIGQGDEVITVSNTAVPTVAAIAATGAIARFVDIDPESYLVDVGQVEQAVTARTACLLPVHLYGQCVDMDPLLDIAEKRGLKVVEDCAQGHGATYKGKKAGSMGDLGVFSFYPTKPLGGYGDGGMVVTRDESLSRKLRRLRYYGMEGDYYAQEEGFCSRLDEIQAEILSVKLKRLEQYIAKRRALARGYHEALKNKSLRLPIEKEGNRHVYYLFVCRHPKRDAIIEELARRGILVNVSYRWPIHLMEGYRHLGYDRGSLPETEKAAGEIFSLPMYPSLRNEQQDEVCSALTDILR